MFKIESYITPIILSHVDKYVKDFRPQDAQVSLWSGAVTFQNLDLRLDVLEDELQLPFNFVSGHVHELIILVPWTKIASEPIQVTINTIEFVLKLKDSTTDRRDNARKKKASRANDELVQQAPPGYMATLVNKIAHNISFKLNNIILKYVEEDIVVSMNVGLLSIDSADDNWLPAFLDINPNKVTLKKVIQITDLTICLDKRNAAGKIDVCQEPILYRCTMEMRLLRKYHMASVQTTSLTRIDIRTDAMDINISSQQFPMLMRLIYLATALKDGKIKPIEPIGSGLDEGDGDLFDDGGVSFFSWAWELMPSIFPTTNPDDDDDQKGHILHTGAYVKQLKVTLKAQEVVTDTITTKRIKYNPIVTGELRSAYFDAVGKGRRWFNAKGGVGSIEILDKNNISVFSTQGVMKSQNVAEDFQMDSLFDQNSIENAGQRRIYNTDWDFHVSQCTEEELWKRTPGIAFDMLHQVEFPDDVPRSSDMGSDLENSNLSERYLGRLFVGGFIFKYGRSFLDVVGKLKEYSATYDYPPYYEEKPELTRSQISPPSTEDFEALMSEIPVKIYQIRLTNPIVELHSIDLCTSNVAKQKKRSHPFLVLELDTLEAYYESPIYPNRLVYTSCQLPNAPSQLIDACYAKWNAQINHLQYSLRFNDFKQTPLRIPSTRIIHKKLLRPDLWSDASKCLTEFDVLIDRIQLTFNRPQQIAFLTMNLALLDAKPEYFTAIIDTSILDDILNRALPVVYCQIDRINCSLKYAKDTALLVGSLQSIEAFASSNCGGLESNSAVVLSSKKTGNLLSFAVQYPLEMDAILHPPILTVFLDEMTVNCDPILIALVEYEARIFKSLESEVIPVQSNASIKKKISIASTERHKAVGAPPRDQPHQHKRATPSIHSSSEPTTMPANVPLQIETKSVEKRQNFRMDVEKYFKLAKCLVVDAEVQRITIIVPNRRLPVNNDNSGSIPMNPNTNHISIKLPSVVVKSSLTRNNSSIRIFDSFPLKIPENQWSAEKEGFPWTLSLNDMQCSTGHNGVETNGFTFAKTEITIVASLKDRMDGPLNSPSPMGHFDISLAIHIDTSPLEITFSERQLLHVYQNESFWKLTKMFTRSENVAKNKKKQLEISQRSATPDIQSDLKEFLSSQSVDDDGLSDDTLKHSDETNSNLPKFHVWLQWTLTKLKLLLIDGPGAHRFSLEFEDIIASIDKQDIYTKTKLKIGTIGSECKRNDNETIETLAVSAHFDAATSIEEDNLKETFFEVTITKAETNSVHDKWGTAQQMENKRSANSNHLNGSLTEICAQMQTIDIRLDLKLMQQFYKIFDIILTRQVAAPLDEDTISCYSVADLPLLFFNCKGIRLFIPITDFQPDCNTLILKINTISIAPSVENPLTRMPVRADIYTKAAQLRILNVPGSKIEDRQYEISLNSISVGTGSWSDICQYFDPTTTQFKTDNPAFEWNQQKSPPSQIETPSLDIATVFSDFNVLLTYAPCIVFKNVLICGEGAEVNCLTDLTLEMTTRQVALAVMIGQQLRLKSIAASDVDVGRKISKVKINRNRKASIFRSDSPDKKFNIQTIKRRISIIDKALTDSGFESSAANKTASAKGSTNFETRSKKRLSIMNSSPKQIPYDRSFVGGIFTFKMYHTLTTENAVKLRLPLICATILQPNCLLCQGIFDKTVKVSLFNASINLGANPEQLKESIDEFSDRFLATRQGKLDSLGIPPSLFQLKINSNAVDEVAIDLDILRPIFIQMSHKTLEKFITIKMLLDQLLDWQEPVSNLKTVPINRTSSSHFSLIRDTYLFGAKKVRFQIQQINVEAVNDNNYDVRMSLTQFNGHIAFHDYPVSLTFNFHLNGLRLSAGRWMLLHPVDVVVAGRLVQENYWQKKSPPLLLYISFKLNCIQVDLGPENIVHLIALRKAFNSCIEHFGPTQDQSDALPIQFERPVHLTPIKVPSAKTTEKRRRIDIILSEEHYQDDLRAGAFQYVEAASANLPLPYQIQIKSEEEKGGVICWRYPQPRALHFIQVFPIPFHASKIKCHLEYYSEAHSNFQPYLEFFLSDTQTNTVDLPVKLKERVTAEIWRVIVQFTDKDVNGEKDDDEEEEDYEEEAFAFVPPQLLVGCMRIDSVFNPCLIPQIQSVVEIDALTINLVNHLSSQQRPMPPCISNYNLIDNLPEAHTFLTLNFESCGFHGSIYILEDILKLSLRAELTTSASVLDYMYLDSIPFVEKFWSKWNLDIKFATQNFFDVDLLADEINLRYGPSIGHALTVSEKLWHQHLDNNPLDPVIISSRYVICNQTTSLIECFQTGAGERARLLFPQECCFYAFKTSKLGQNLTFMIEGTLQERSFSGASVQISTETDEDENRIQILPIIDEQWLIVKQHKLSATQKKITLKGQMEFMTMTEETLRIQFRENAKEPNKPTEFNIKKGLSRSVVARCDKNSNHIMRLRLPQGVDRKSGWSGDIPLRNTAKNIPWLVKVPSSTNRQEFVSYWVRVIREDIPIKLLLNHPPSPEVPQRILIVVWPLFVIRSLLSVDTRAHETGSGLTYNLKGRGKEHEIQAAATHETEHEFSFDFDFSSFHGEDKTKALLSYKALDRNKFFFITEKFQTIEPMINELEKPHKINWPSSLEHELRVQRKTTKQDCPTVPLYKCFPSRELSCSLMLDVVPWCLFINTTDVDILLQTIDDQLTIECNSIAMPFLLDKSFQILILDDGEWKMSQQVAMSGWAKDKSSALLPEDGSIVVRIFARNGFREFLLTSSTENGTRVVTLAPQLIFANFSSVGLSILPFACSSPEEIDHIDLKRWQHIPSSRSTDGQGLGITWFYHYQATKSKISAIFDKKPNFYIAIKNDDCKEESNYNRRLTIIPLSKGFNRRCFCIPNAITKYHALSMSLIEYPANSTNTSQLFASVFDDKMPLLQIENRTTSPLLVAELQSLDQNTRTEFDAVQLIPPDNGLFFTPITVDSQFPDYHSLNVGIVFAMDDNPIKWSAPINVLIQENVEAFFINIPSVGDIKLTVDRRRHTIHAILDHIDYKTEFNVKDIRTKLQLRPARSDFDEGIIEAGHAIKRMIKSDESTDPTQSKIVFALSALLQGINFTLFADNSAENPGVPKELIAIYFDNVAVEFHSHKPSNDLEISFSNLQIDNQLFPSGQFDFPVVICADGGEYSPNKPSRSLKPIKPLNPLGLFTVTLDDEFNLMDIVVKFQPIRAYLEDTYLNAVLDFMVEFLPPAGNLMYMPEEEEGINRIELTKGMFLMPKIVQRQAISLSEPFRLNLIRIEESSAILSVHACMRMYIALDHSPLSFSSFERRNLSTLPVRLGYNLGMNYLSGAIFGAGWVVGSLEILGSPSGLARSFSTGIRDFVALPFQGLFRGPWGFFVGVTQGSASLLRNVTAGTVNSVTKLAASVARNLDRLTLDDEHLQRTETLRRIRPQGVTDGLTQGLTGLGVSMLGAIGGLARHPMQATSPVGIVTGMGRGLVGAVTKPISGAAELVALTGQGVLYSVGFNAMPTSRNCMQKKRLHQSVASISSCKILWKCLPNGFVSDAILFFGNNATIFDGADVRRQCTIAITTKMLGLVSVDGNWIEWIPLEKVVSSIDDDVETINLRVIEKVEDTNEGDGGVRRNNEGGVMTFMQYGRVLQYVRDCSSATSPPPPTADILANYIESTRAAGLLMGHDDENEIVSLVEKPKERQFGIMFERKALCKYFVEYLELIRAMTAKA